MRNNPLLWLLVAGIGLLLAILGPRYAPETFAPSSRPFLLALIFITCSIALYQRWQQGKDSDQPG